MITTIEKAINDFSIYITQLGYSSTTYKMIPRCIKEFLQHQHITDITSITQAHIQTFYEYLHTRPNKHKAGALSESYIHHHLFAIKVFLNYLEETGEITDNPMSVMKFKKPQANTRKPLFQNEIQQLFESAINLKETTLLHLFYSCGLRRNEAERLNTSDIHFKQNILYVREGKGAKRRAIPLTARVSKELEFYFLNEKTNQKNVKDTDAFMLNKTGNRMRGDSYNHILKSIIERTGISKQTSLHHLRHSIATHLLENKLSIEYVRDFLGHSHLETTQLYAKVSQYQLNFL